MAQSVWETSTRTSDWKSGYKSIQKALNHLARKTKSEASRLLLLEIIYRLIKFSSKSPDELVSTSRGGIEETIQDYLDSLEEKGLSRKRIKTERSYILLFFRQNGFKNGNELDIAHYSVPARYRIKPQYIPTIEEVIKMADSASNLKAAAAILCLASSGLRNATIRALTYGDIRRSLDDQSECVFVPVYPEMKKRLPNACKNKIPYYTFFAPVAVSRLKAYLEKRKDKQGKIGDEEILFCSSDSKVRRREFIPLQKNYFSKILKESARNAGIERWKDIDAHSLRKTFEDVLDRPGIDGRRMDVKTREFLMGHILPGSQDPYFGSGVQVSGSQISFKDSQVDAIRADYLNLNFTPHLGVAKKETVLEAIRRFAEPFGIDPMRIRIEKQKELGRNPSTDEEISLIQDEIRRLREPREDPQMIVKETDLQARLTEGWQFVSVLPSKRILLRK